jgi:glycerate 2-kinase
LKGRRAFPAHLHIHLRFSCEHATTTPSRMEDLKGLLRETVRSSSGSFAFRAAIAASDPSASVFNSFQWAADGSLDIAGVRLAPGSFDEVVLVAAGKAAGAMADAALDALLVAASGPRIRGVIVTKHGHALPRSRADAQAGTVDLVGVEAGHPTPDAAGLSAAERVLALARSCGPRSLFLVLLSGGGSALLPLPAHGLTLADLQATNDALLACGAPIDDVNCVRKHISRLSGGRLAAAAADAGAVRIVTLALSDVIGDRADVIASGPTVPDPTTFADALDVLARYNIARSLPPAVVAHLAAGAGPAAEPAGGEREEDETPKLPIPTAHFSLVGGNASALEAVAEVLSAASFTPYVLTSSLQGEAKEAGKTIAALVHGSLQAKPGREPFRLPAALLFGGETTVSLGPQPPGKGGRNMELALSAAVALKALMLPPQEGAARPVTWAVMAFGTDGTDGPTDAAGAIVNPRTVEAGLRLGMDARDFLARHDAYSFFAGLGEGEMGDGGPGGLLITGPTGTNVGDVTIVVVAEGNSIKGF